MDEKNEGGLQRKPLLSFQRKDRNLLGKTYAQEGGDQEERYNNHRRGKGKDCRVYAGEGKRRNYLSPELRKALDRKKKKKKERYDGV